jgi:hypothetical protein
VTWQRGFLDGPLSIQPIFATHPATKEMTLLLGSTGLIVCIDRDCGRWRSHFTPNNATAAPADPQTRHRYSLQCSLGFELLVWMWDKIYQGAKVCCADAEIVCVDTMEMGPNQTFDAFLQWLFEGFNPRVYSRTVHLGAQDCIEARFNLRELHKQLYFGNNRNLTYFTRANQAYDELLDATM